MTDTKNLRLTEKTLENSNITVEELYLQCIADIANCYKSGKEAFIDTYISEYKFLCETLAMKHMHEKGFYDMPYFNVVPDYSYNEELEQYVKDFKEPHLDAERIREQYKLEDKKIEIYKITVQYYDKNDWLQIDPLCKTEYYKTEEAAAAALDEYEKTLKPFKTKLEPYYASKREFFGWE